MPPILFENNKFRLWKESAFEGYKEVLFKSYVSDFPDQETMMMLNNEYSILRDINIPGVRRLLGKTEVNNTDALVFEYITGKSLAEQIEDNPYSIEKFLEIAIQLSRVLGSVHEAGIIHRDINTKNILISNEGEVYLIDFGIASRRDVIVKHLGSPELLQGHLPYISPEQTGRMNRVVDFRSDFYSLGVVFYEMLTGRLPFDSTDPLELVHSHLALNPKAPNQIEAQIPDIISKITLKLLSKNADDRYQSAFSLQADLEQCMAFVKENKPIEFFEPGIQHAHGRFTLPQKLYGREKELQQLTTCLSQLGNTSPQMVLICGEPGVGKSALVNEIHKEVTGKRAIIISGKFDQYQRNIPYYAIQKALTDWAQMVLSEREEKLQEWKEIILDAVGELGRSIINLVPEIEIIIGPQPDLPALNGQEAQNRFNYIFGKFIKAISRVDFPLILFIDDLQWADLASLDLIKRILEDKENQNLFMIGAYRDNEIDNTHPLQILLDRLDNQLIPITYLNIHNLQLSDVTEFLSDAIFSEKKTIQPLSEFVYEKTGGNPIFLKQFIQALHKEGMLEFNQKEKKWVWDIGAISSLQISDNIVDLMIAKIKRLPEKTQNVLKRAACIGSNFDADLLGVIAEIPLNEVIEQLEPAIEESLILPKGNTYRFAEAKIKIGKKQKIELGFIHDRIQQAFYSLIPDKENKKVHLRIGRLLDQSADERVRKEKIFDIVFQLNTGVDLIDNGDEKIHLANLNLQAGEKAIDSSAHNTALQLIENGLTLLPENPWQSEYNLTFRLHEKGAEAAYLSGESDRMNKLTDHLISHARTAAEMKKVYMFRIDDLTAKNKLPEGLNAGLELLDKLGVSFPGNPKTVHIISGLMKTKWLLKGKKPEDLKELDVMSDPNMIAALPILERIVPPAYMSGSNMFPLIVFKMVELSVKHGNMPYSAFGYGSYGISLSAVLGDYDGGFRFGQMALDLVDKFDSEEYRVKVLFVTDCFLNHWKQHLRLSIPPLLDAYKSGMKVGNLVGGIWAAYYYLLWHFYSGEELFGLNEKLESYKRTFLQLKQQAAYNRTSVLQTLVQNISSQSEGIELGLATHTNASEQEMLKELIETNDKTSLFFYHSNKLLLHLLRVEPKKAGEQASKAKEYKEAVAGLPELTFFTFFESLVLIYLSLAERDSLSTKKIKKNLKNLKKWADTSPSNYRHQYLLIRGGYLFVKGSNISEVLPFFDEAIQAARQEKYIQIEAMAYELAARCCFEAKLNTLGQMHIQRAYDAYLFWGADAKATMLRSEFNDIILNLPKTSGSHSSSGSRSGLLDLATVIKASTTISGEIRFQDLLQTLLKIVIESAGAERAVLIMNQQSQHVIVADGTIHDIEIFDGIKIEEYKEIPQSLLLYCLRTGEELIIPDASGHQKWSADKYIKQSNTKSVLCTLIKNQGKIIAIMYLENNLATNSFTSERVELLNMLSGQIAISIENAQLYSNLEIRVEERTKELQGKNKQIEKQNKKLEVTLQRLKATQNQLIHSEKMASLGELTAGIAHEIKNPLNFVNNFSELSMELIEEARVELSAFSDQLSADDNGKVNDALEILDDIETNLRKIHVHGSRADSIVKSMLQHSRGGSGQFEPTKLNPLIKEYVNLAFHGMRAGKDPINVEIDLQLDESIVEIPLFAEDFSRVVLNICNNAFDAMREKLSAVSDQPSVYQPKLTVRTLQKDKTVKIEIEDNGPGISEEIKDKILQPFFTTKKGTQGTGLGLSITNDIIKAHGGSMDIHSKPGQTVFTIKLIG
ncbi:MAG: AAA family ATPase [Bacteroidales bacterium]